MAEDSHAGEDPEDRHAGDPHAGDPHAGDPHAGDRHSGGAQHHGPALSDEVVPLAVDSMPQRPRPLFEFGEPFLGTGTLDPGITLPTGAVWQPSGLIFGTLRVAAQSFESDASSDARITEVATRLDLFFNLYLSGSERLVAGIRALDGDGRFTSYVFDHPDPSLDDSFQDELDAELDTLFFEGDFGEIFPDLDREDLATYDIGFSVGRQSLLFQEGLLIDDTIDGIGLTRNSLQPATTSNLRATLFYGWGNVDSSFGARRDAQLFALLTSTDFRRSTVDADLAFVRSEDAVSDLVVAGVSAVQRLGRVNSSFRLLASEALDDDSARGADGALLFSELSWVPRETHDLVYVNGFWAVDRFTPAARGVGGAGAGPLGRAGINFASVGLGSFDAPLSSQAWDVAGAAIGYQRFFDATRKQLLVELGGRFGTESSVDDAFALTVRFQSAFGQRVVLVTDGFAGRRDDGLGDARHPFGGRIELLVKF